MRGKRDTQEAKEKTNIMVIPVMEVQGVPTLTQELVPKGTIKNLPILTQELHYGNYLTTCICLF